MPYLGKSPSFGVRQRYQYTATAGQTTFSGTDTENLTLNYTDNNFVDVYQNGVLLKGGGNDYTATSGTSVVLATGASVSDVIEIIVYDAFSAGNFYNRTDSDSRYVNVDGDTMTDGLTISTADNDAQLTLTSTDADSGIGPHQVFYRNSASPADADLLCELDFRGRNDNSENVDYAVINVKANDVSDGTEDGEFILQVATNGSTDTTMHIKPAEIVFNEDSIDRDFRVESDGVANMLFVNAGDNAVCIGKNTTALGTAGSAFLQNYAHITADNDSPLTLNRLNTDGILLDLRKNGSSVGTISTNGNSLPSDKNFKRDIKDLNIGLDLVSQLQPKSFNTIVDDENSPVMYGLIAQDLEVALEKVGVTKNSAWILQHEEKNDAKESDYKLNYTKLIPILINAVQELEARIKTLEGA